MIGGFSKLVASVALVSLFYILHSAGAVAFKTGYGFTPVHGNIIRKALSKKGFSEASIQKIKEGADSQDELTSKKFTASPRNHFDDNLIKKGIKYYKARFSLVPFMARDAYKDSEKRDAAIWVWGEGLHTVQDFYSHSNYAEMLAAKGGPFKIVDWDNLPSGLKTGYFYYYNALVNEASVPRNQTCRNLVNQFAKEGKKLKFHSSLDWRNRKKAVLTKEQLAYVLSEHDLIHRELNKDDHKSLAGSVELSDGKTMHAVARDLAIKETERQWRLLKKEIKKVHKKRAQLIIPALKGHVLPSMRLKCTVPETVDAGRSIRGKIYLRLNNAPDPYDIAISVKVTSSVKMESYIKRTLKKKKTGNYTIEFESPVSGLADSCVVKIKAKFVADSKFRNKSLTRRIKVQRKAVQQPPSASRNRLTGTKWQGRGFYHKGGKNDWGTCHYSVRVLDASPSRFQLWILGHKRGNKAEVFTGTRNGRSFFVQGYWYGHGTQRDGEKKVVKIKGVISPDGTSASGYIQDDFKFDAKFVSGQ